MEDKFEIEIHEDSILVFAENGKGRSVLLAEFNPDMSLDQLAMELYELLALAGHPVKFVEKA